MKLKSAYSNLAMHISLPVLRWFVGCSLFLAASSFIFAVSNPNQRVSALGGAVFFALCAASNAYLIRLKPRMPERTQEEEKVGTAYDVLVAALCFGWCLALLGSRIWPAQMLNSVFLCIALAFGSLRATKRVLYRFAGIRCRTFYNIALLILLLMASPLKSPNESEKELVEMSRRIVMLIANYEPATARARFEDALSHFSGPGYSQVRKGLIDEMLPRIEAEKLGSAFTEVAGFTRIERHDDSRLAVVRIAGHKELRRPGQSPQNEEVVYYLKISGDFSSAERARSASFVDCRAAKRPLAGLADAP